MCVCPAGWAHCGCVVVSRVCFRSLFLLPVWWNGRHARLKSGRPVGRAGSSPATGTRGSETVEYGACGRVLWPTLGACSPVVGVTCGALVSRLGDWCAGSCCASCVRFVFAVLFPLFWTVIQHGCWVRLLSGSLTLCGWGSIPLLSAGVHAPAWWGFPPPLPRWAGRGLLSFPCLDRVRVVVAPRGRALPLGVFGYFPFIYGLAAAGVAACGSGTRDSLFGVVWFPCVVVLGRRR